MSPRARPGIVWHCFEVTDENAVVAALPPRGAARTLKPLAPPGLGVSVEECALACSTPRLLARFAEGVVEAALERFGVEIASSSVDPAVLASERANEPHALSFSEVHGLLAQLDGLVARVRESVSVLARPGSAQRVVCSAPRISFPDASSLCVHMFQAADTRAGYEAPQLPHVSVADLLDDSMRALACELVRRSVETH